MNTKLTSLCALIFAAQVSAHSEALPHTHHGDHISWAPSTAILALLAIAAIAVRKALARGGS